MEILTAGHSNFSFAKFEGLLKQHGVTLIVDVRSRPLSRWQPHFNREKLSQALHEQGIDYRYSGSILGGRNDTSVEAETFVAEMDVVLQLIANGHRVALMCSEARFRSVTGPVN